MPKPYHNNDFIVSENVLLYDCSITDNHWMTRWSRDQIRAMDKRFLNFAADDANDLYGLLVELFGERGIFVVDESQNVPGWEHFVRRFMELGLKFPGQPEPGSAGHA